MWATFLLQALIFNDLLVNSSLLTNNKNDNIKDHYASTIKGSCRNNCDVHSVSKCSCDVRCKIIGNCCKDFRNSCPEEFKKSEKRFESFVQLLQECDPSGYLLISECPHDESLLKEVDTDIVTRLQSISEGHGSVNRLFSHVPVTDIDSGFSFKNVSVYLCNAMPGKTMKFWNVYIDKFSLGSNGVLAYDAISQVQFRIFPPIPLDNYTNLFRCYFKDSKRTEIDSSKLNKMASLDFEGFDSSCALCSTQMNKSEKGKQPKRSNRHIYTFPIMGSFENNQFIFQTEPLYSGDEVVPWRYMQCSNIKMDKDEKAVDHSLCFIKSCSKEFDQTADGQCKMLYILQLAVPDDAIPMTKSFLGRLSSYLECYLTKYSGYDVVDKWHLSERFLYDDQQKSYFITRLWLYSSKEINIIDNPKDAEYHFSKFAEVIQVLRSYKLSAKDSEKSLELLPVKSFTVELLRGLEFNWDVDKPRTMQVCADLLPRYFIKHTQFENVHLRCAYVPVADDEGNKTREEMDTENNTCLNVFTFSAQRAHKRPTAFVLYLALSCFILK